MKLGRRYKLVIQYDDAGNTVEVDFPLTLEIDIRRTTFASASMGFFRIYNLAAANRLRLVHDYGDYSHYRQIKLFAGYQDEIPLPLVFQGNVIQAQSYRQRSNFVTEIQAYSGFFAIKNSKVATTVQSGYDGRQTILQILQNMNGSHVTAGAVGNFSGNQSARGVTFSGDAWDAIQQIAGDDAQVFIDNEKAYVLKENDYVASDLGDFVVSSETGLLETPKRNQFRLDVQLLFEPRINIGNVINLKSKEKVYNGRYPVIGVNHQGAISGAVSGAMTTTLNVWKGTALLNPVRAT